VQKHSNRGVLQKKEKNGDYLKNLSIPLTETERNRNHKSETRRKTKQMRKGKRSIWFEPLYKCKNLTPNLQEKKESKTRKQQNQDENWEQNSVKKKDKNTREDIRENSGLCKKQSNQSLLQKKKKKKTETTSKDCQWRSLIWHGEIKITDPRQGGKRNSNNNNNNKWEKKNNQSDLNVVYKCKNLMPNCLQGKEKNLVHI